jgi:hypothetical protein
MPEDPGMQTFTQFALPATILASAVGAVVLCVILFFYGFRSEEDEGPSPARRLFVMRLGHAIAAACFAAALMLGSVALIDQRRAALVASAVTAQSTEDVRRLEAQVTSLEERLAATELRLGDAVQQLSAVASRVATARPASRPARRTTQSARRPAPTSIAREGMASPVTQRELGEATTARPAASTPMIVSANTSASEDLGARVRGGWKAVKKGFGQVGDDVRSGFTDLGRRLKKTFE